MCVPSMRGGGGRGGGGDGGRKEGRDRGKTTTTKLKTPANKLLFSSNFIFFKR